MLGKKIDDVIKIIESQTRSSSELRDLNYALLNFKRSRLKRTIDRKQNLSKKLDKILIKLGEQKAGGPLENPFIVFFENSLKNKTYPFPETLKLALTSKEFAPFKVQLIQKYLPKCDLFDANIDINEFMYYILFRSKHNINNTDDRITFKSLPFQYGDMKCKIKSWSMVYEQYLFFPGAIRWEQPSDMSRAQTIFKETFPFLNWLTHKCNEQNIWNERFIQIGNIIAGYQGKDFLRTENAVDKVQNAFAKFAKYFTNIYDNETIRKLQDPALSVDEKAEVFIKQNTYKCAYFSACKTHLQRLYENLLPADSFVDINDELSKRWRQEITTRLVFCPVITEYPIHYFSIFNQCNLSRVCKLPNVPDTTPELYCPYTEIFDEATWKALYEYTRGSDTLTELPRSLEIGKLIINNQHENFTDIKNVTFVYKDVKYALLFRKCSHKLFFANIAYPSPLYKHNVDHINKVILYREKGWATTINLRTKVPLINKKYFKYIVEGVLPTNVLCLFSSQNK